MEPECRHRRRHPCGQAGQDVGVGQQEVQEPGADQAGAREMAAQAVLERDQPAAGWVWADNLPAAGPPLRPVHAQQDQAVLQCGPQHHQEG